MEKATRFCSGGCTLAIYLFDCEGIFVHTFISTESIDRVMAQYGFVKFYIEGVPVDTGTLNVVLKKRWNYGLKIPASRS